MIPQLLISVLETVTQTEGNLAKDVFEQWKQKFVSRFCIYDDGIYGLCRNVYRIYNEIPVNMALCMKVCELFIDLSH